MTRAKHPVTAILLAFTWVVLATTSALSDIPKRYALVIGNSDYHYAGEAPNAARDAAQIAQSLSELHFQVIAGFNVDRQGFERLVAQLGQQAADAGADTVLIYYAGHGIQLAGRNHLVPVDADLENRGDGAGTLVLDDILASVQSPLRQTIALIDACRGDPVQAVMQPGGAGSGLARIQTGESTFVAFAAEPGTAGCNAGSGASLFADALLTHIGKPNLSLADLMLGVREEVSGRTLGRQVPWAQSSLRGDFSFNPLEPYRVASSEADDLPVAGRETEPARTAKAGLVIGAAEGREVESSQTSPTLKRLLPVNSQRIGADASNTVATAREADQTGPLAALDPTVSPDTTSPGAPPTATGTSAADNLALATPPEPRVKPEVPETQDDLIRPIQEKLRKIGCYRGAVDGQWGPQSRSAVKRYHSAKGRAARSLEPAQDLLTRLEGESKTVCAPAKRTATKQKKTTTKRSAKTRQARATTPPPQHWEESPPPAAPMFHIGPYGGINLGIGF